MNLLLSMMSAHKRRYKCNRDVARQILNANFGLRLKQALWLNLEIFGFTLGLNTYKTPIYIYDNVRFV